MIRFLPAHRVVPIAFVCALALIAALWIPHRFSRSGPATGEDGSHGHFAVLNWKPSTSSVVGYNVYRSEDPHGPFKKLNAKPIRETTYKDSAVQPGHAYSYTVTAVDRQGQESGFSNQVRASVPSS